MATTFTLAEMRTKVRERADMVNSTFVSNAEINGYINASYAELYDLIVQKYGDNYYVAPFLTFQTDGLNEQYALPNGTNYAAAPALYKLLGVDIKLGASNDSYVNVSKFEFRDRNRFAVPNFQTFYGLTNLRYRLHGANLLFTPLPAAGQTIRLTYVPRITYLVADADTIDGISGWEEYVVIDAAKKCLQKEESDVSILMAEKQGLINRIEAAAENRDAGSPFKVSDAMRDDFWWPNGSSDGFGMY